MDNSTHQRERQWLAQQLAKLPTELTETELAVERGLTRDLEVSGLAMYEQAERGCTFEEFCISLTDFVVKHRRAALDEQRERLGK